MKKRTNEQNHKPQNTSIKIEDEDEDNEEEEQEK